MLITHKYIITFKHYEYFYTAKVVLLLLLKYLSTSYTSDQLWYILGHTYLTSISMTYLI